MPAPLKTGAEAKPLRSRHGKQGFVRLGVDVTPEQKDRLVARARATGQTQSALVRYALNRYLRSAR